jgi:hypothetical protein
MREGTTASHGFDGEPSGTEAPLRRVLRRFASEGEAHMTVPATEEELRRIEEATGAPIPADARELLRTLGAGMYDRGHEVFGPTRVMIHDIELVPDMLSVRARLRAEISDGDGLLPLHRGAGRVHLVRTKGPRAGEIVSHPAGASYPDLVTFLETVMFATPGH